ncbi:hypothetical protein M9H77_16124 [Catharanthus roseus]|uniref:Uncharacterized protein n=1 Tax=Catharanthus roseus TaxID=4058 RepID=A0ACC0B187_CATRO|nr:hypothetical protein M9H77_16124 [Catharanthus roseus]
MPLITIAHEVGNASFCEIPPNRKAQWYLRRIEIAYWHRKKEYDHQFKDYYRKKITLPNPTPPSHPNKIQKVRQNLKEEQSDRTTAIELTQIVFESDVILVDGVPLLNSDLLSSGSSLSSHELLEVSDGVVVVALHPDLLTQPIVQHHLNHLRY